VRPSVVITLAVLVLAILGAGALQFLVLGPQGNGPTDTVEDGAPSAVVIDA